jgi:F-type H+-transporting ATPase subunit epsilon
VRVQTDKGEELFFVTGGILEVQPHLVSVLADSAVHGDQLDETAALEARERARAALEGRRGKVDLSRAQAELAEAEARYVAAQKRKGKHTSL